MTLYVPFTVIYWKERKYAHLTGESLTSNNGLMGCTHHPPYKQRPGFPDDFKPVRIGKLGVPKVQKSKL